MPSQVEWLQQGKQRVPGKIRALLLLFTATLLANSSASAQLTASQLEMVVTPSAAARVVSTFLVHNDGDSAVQAIITREDWDRTLSGENRFAPSGSTSTSCGESVSFSPESFRIEPRAERVVRVAVEKTSGPARECRDILFVQEFGRKRTLAATGLQYTFRTGVKIYVDPSGLTRDAEVTSMSAGNVGADTEKNRVTSGSSDTVKRLTIEFHNTGSIHLLSHGSVEIRRLDNSVAAQIQIPPFPTLPGATRLLSVDIPASLANGNYVALAMLDFGGAEIAAGELELTLKQ
jgi:P pilus assembly chaperone PapD